MNVSEDRALAERLRGLGYGSWSAPADFADRVLDRRAVRTQRTPARLGLRLAGIAAALGVGTLALAQGVSGGLFHFRFGHDDPGVVAVQVGDSEGKPMTPKDDWKPNEPVRDIADVFATFQRGVREGRYDVAVTRGVLKDLSAGAPDGSAGIAPPDGQERAADFYTFRSRADQAFVGRIAAEPESRVWLGAFWAR